MNFKIQIILILSISLIVSSAQPKKRKNNKNKKSTPNGTKKPKLDLPKMDGASQNETTTAGCKDEGTNCKEYISHCNEKSYEEMLKRHCNLSCGYCAPAKDSCNDLSQTCAEMKKKGFCGSKIHSINQQRIFCAKECDLCEK